MSNALLSLYKENGSQETDPSPIDSSLGSSDPELLIQKICEAAAMYHPWRKRSQIDKLSPEMREMHKQNMQVPIPGVTEIATALRYPEAVESVIGTHCDYILRNALAIIADLLEDRNKFQESVERLNQAFQNDPRIGNSK